jgi:CheY-like chemotaxis protein
VSETAKDRIAPFVYVVDRERGTADALAAMLNESGYEAIAFSSGEQLVEAATVLKPDIVVTAVLMEGMSGVEAAIRICQNIPECELFCALPRSLLTNLFVESLRRIASSSFRGQLILAHSCTASTA